MLGHGIGLRPPHYRQVLADGAPGIDWFEVISENFLAPGGPPRRILRAVRERFPVVLHGVSMNLGSADPLDLAHLDRLRALCAEIEPALVSDHLCFTGVDGATGHDLWPLPSTRAALEHLVARVHAAQERLGRQLLVENVSAYVRYAHADMAEHELLAELTRRTGCGLLLDVNNVFVSAQNLGFDAEAYLAGLPVDAVKQIHLAGHRDCGTHLLDTHDEPVRDEVWALYATATERFGAVPTLIERDDKLPPLAALVDEAQQARAVQSVALARGLRRAA
jgi:hypothetical protein